MNTGIYGYLAALGKLPLLLGGQPNFQIPPPPGVAGMNPGQAAFGGGPGMPGKLDKGPMGAISPPLPPPTGGFLGGVDRLLGGAGLQGLNPANAADARRQGLLAAGAQMLLASGRRPGRGAGLGEVVGQGILAGQQGYGQGIQQGQEQQAMQRRQEVWSQLQPKSGESPTETYARLQRMLTLAIEGGDKASVGPIAQAIASAGSLINEREPKSFAKPWVKEGFADTAEGQAEYYAWKKKAEALERPPASGEPGVPAHMKVLDQQLQDAELMVTTLERVEPRPPTNPLTGIIDPNGLDQFKARHASWVKRMEVAQARYNRLLERQDKAASRLYGWPVEAPAPAPAPPPLPFGSDPRNPFPR